MRIAAASSMRWPEDLLTSTLSTLPSLSYRDAELQLAEDLLAARLLGVIQVADAFHFDAPILDILREAVFLRACADEFAARQFLVVIPILVDLRFEARHFQGFLYQFIAVVGVSRFSAS